MAWPLFQRDMYENPGIPFNQDSGPKLCGIGRLFEQAIQEANALSSEPDYWVVSIVNSKNSSLWIQFTHDCANISDVNSLRHPSEALSKRFKLVSYEQGVYATIQSTQEISCAETAALVCSYWRQQFPGEIVDQTWTKDVYKC